MAAPRAQRRCPYRTYLRK